jgi:F-type H+-transporting ATPase subunit delta
MQASVDEQEVAVARVYASSLLELAESRGEADEVLEELGGVSALLEEHPDFADFLANPTVESERRREAIERIFRDAANELLVNTLQVMNNRDRLGLVTALAEAYRQELDRLRGRERVEVVSAVPLSDALRSRLRRAVSRLTRGEADLVETVEEKLIGGLVVQVGDQKFDSSVARTLALLGTQLQERMSQEVQAAGAYVVDTESSGEGDR